MRSRRFAGFLVALPLAVLAVPASAVASVFTFSNPAPVAIVDEGNASPYPSTIAVDGLAGPVQKATVALRGFSHTCPNDVSILVVAPSGARSILISDLGPGEGCPPATNADLTFDDAAAGSVPYPPVTGTFKPTDGMPGSASFGAPAPPPPYPAALASFDGVDQNGTWTLFVNDDAGGDTGSIARGWGLTLTAVSNAFELGKLKRNKKRGTAKVAVDVPDPGTLDLAGKGLKPTSKEATAAGELKLKIKAKGGKKKRLQARGKAKVTPELTYTPAGGEPRTQSTKVKLVKK